jgi:Crp-like helix-turn-helix protein
MTQVSRVTACNRVHSNKQRCARWLLPTYDRVGKDEFQLTQEFLSQMLGVRRATVNEIAGDLQSGAPFLIGEASFECWSESVWKLHPACAIRLFAMSMTACTAR